MSASYIYFIFIYFCLLAILLYVFIIHNYTVSSTAFFNNYFKVLKMSMAMRLEGGRGGEGNVHISAHWGLPQGLGREIK